MTEESIWYFQILGPIQLNLSLEHKMYQSFHFLPLFYQQARYPFSHKPLVEKVDFK